jgi:hypothetical protein
MLLSWQGKAIAACAGQFSTVSIKQILQKTSFFMIAMLIVMVIIMFSMLFSILRRRPRRAQLNIGTLNNFIQFSPVKPHAPAFRTEVNFNSLPFCKLKIHIT